MKEIKYIFVIFLLIISAFNIVSSAENVKNQNDPVVSMATEFYSLVIGTTSENDCRNDAIDMHYVLKNNGWNEDNMKLNICNMATKYNFFNNMEWIDSQENINDVVLFFYAGHASKKGIYLYDPDTGRYDDYLKYSEMQSYFDNLESEKVVLIFDSCYSGILNRNRNSLIRTRLTSNPLCRGSNSASDHKLNFEDFDIGALSVSFAKPGRIILAGCDKNEYTDNSPEYENGYFTYHLVEGFKGKGDSNNNGWVSAEEAFEYARPKVEEDTRNAPGVKTQHPQIYDGISGDLDITEVGYFEYEKSDSQDRHSGIQQRFLIIVKKIRNLLK